MADKLLERGLKIFRRRLPDAAAVEVQIRADNVAIEQLEVVPGRRNFMQFVVEDAAGTEQVFDWIVPEQNLRFPGKGKLQPESGWEVWYTQEDGRKAVFVVRPETGTRAFDVVDPLGLLYRIHTVFDRFEA